MKRVVLLCMILFLSACKIEPEPKVWPAELNPYMEERGYTLGSDGYTILKNGYPVWFDEPCFGRGCFGTNRALVPDELISDVRSGILNAVKESREEFVLDISRRIGVEQTTVDANEEIK